MTTSLLSPEAARTALAAGARLIDIRDADEHARERIPEARCVPLAQVETLAGEPGPVIFHCRSGARTAANAARLKAAVNGAPVHLLDGGIDGWRAAGYATIVDRAQPLELMRQAQIAAGLLVLLGLVLGVLVAPGFLLLSGFVGAGLLFAGATGWCGMARLLRVMPWNARAAA